MKFAIGIVFLSTLLSFTAVAVDEARPVSLVQLIANPDKFNGKLVVVFGYLRLSERPALYLHEDDAANSLMTNALWIDSTESMRQHRTELSQRYVKIVGRFRAGGEGHVYFLSGGITDVEECTPWPLRPGQKNPGHE